MFQTGYPPKVSTFNGPWLQSRIRQQMTLYKNEDLVSLTASYPLTEGNSPLKTSEKPRMIVSLSKNSKGAFLYKINITNKKHLEKSLSKKIKKAVKQALFCS